MTRRILITGISGVGKSTVTAALAARGFLSIDLDSPDYSHWVNVMPEDDLPGTPVERGRDWMWREERVAALLNQEHDDELLFVSGTAANMGRFLPRFYRVILLSTAPEIIVERLQTRTNNEYGKHPNEVARVLDLKTSVEPLLRRVASHEVDTKSPLDVVVEQVIQIATTV